MAALSQAAVAEVSRKYLSMVMLERNIGRVGWRCETSGLSWNTVAVPET